MPSLSKTKKKLQNQDGHKKNVQMNLDLLAMKAILKMLQEKRLLMTQNLTDFDTENSNFEDESNEVTASIRESKSEIDRLMGRKEALKSQQRDLKVSVFIILILFSTRCRLSFSTVCSSVLAQASNFRIS